MNRIDNAGWIPDGWQIITESKFSEAISMLVSVVTDSMATSDDRIRAAEIIIDHHRRIIDQLIAEKK